jgi:hypothetical protein
VTNNIYKIETRSSLFLVLVFSFQFLFAQKMVPGYIITINGDSLTGAIASKDLKKKVSGFLFYSNGRGNIEKYISIHDCIAFGLYDPPTRFERWTGEMDQSYIGQNFQLENEGVVITDTVFLKIIFMGKSISLYQHYDVRDHFFVKYNGEMQELIVRYTSPKDNPLFDRGRAPHHDVWKIFRNQLYQYFDWMHNKKLKIKVDFAEYDRNDFLSIISSIDEINSGKKKIKKR